MFNKKIVVKNNSWLALTIVSLLLTGAEWTRITLADRNWNTETDDNEVSRTVLDPFSNQILPLLLCSIRFSSGRNWMILGRGTFPAGWTPLVPSGNGNCLPLLEGLSGGALLEGHLRMLCSNSFHAINLPMINPIVTSSGKRILSPMLMNLPSPAIGSIRRVRALLKQKPAPPVANQKVIFFEGVSVGIFYIKKKTLLNGNS